MSFLLIGLSVLVFQACQKENFDSPTLITENPFTNPIDKQAKDQFFKSPSDLHPELQGLIQNLRTQDTLRNFISNSWIKKNGLALWDKTFSNLDYYNTAHATNADKGFLIYFTPLQSLQLDKIQAYIVTYQKDSSYYHRLYNFDELVRLKSGDKEIQNKILGILSVFGYFESVINNKSTLLVGEPFNTTFENAFMKFGGTGLKVRSACTEISVTGGQQVVMGWSYADETVCWDALTSYRELAWSTGANSPGGWPSSGTGTNGGVGVTTWSGTSYNALNISDLMSALVEIPKQQILNLYPNEAAFINFVFSLKNAGEVLTEAYVERLYTAFDKYQGAGFSNSEIVSLCKNETLFNQIDAFLSQNGYNSENRIVVKGFTFLMDVDDDFKVLNQNRGNKTIKQLLDEVGYPNLKSSTLIGLARRNGVDVNIGNNFTRLGRIQEDAVARSLGAYKNKREFEDPKQQRSAVEPDVIGNGFISQWEVTQNGLRVLNTWEGDNSAFFDSKFVSGNEKVIKDNATTNANGTVREQLSTMIDVLSQMRGGWIKGVKNTLMKPSDHGIAFLVIVTFKDVDIDPNLIAQAQGANVNIYKRWLIHDPESNKVVVSTNYEDKTPFIATRKPGAFDPPNSAVLVDIDWTIK